jgi:outer membrane autotransporter protein
MLNGYVGNRGSFGGVGPAANGFAAEPKQMPETVSAYAALERATGRLPPGDQRWHSWGSAYGGQSNTSGDTATGSNSTRAAAFGLAAGMDYHPSADAVVGFALAGGSGNWNIANGNGGGRSEVFQAGLYGSQQFGASYVSAAASYAWHSMSTNRTAVAADTLTANFDANNIAGRLETGHRFDAPMSFAITPYAAAQVQAFYLPGYTESETVVSNQYALSYTSRTATTIRSELGAWFDTRSLVGNGNTTLFSRIAWAHDWNSDPTVSASFPGLPGTSFTVNGAAPPTNLALVTAGAEFRLSRGVILSAKFDGGFAGGYQSYAGTGTLRYSWN